MKLLLVEDVELDAELVTAELRHQGYDFALTRVDTADGLRAALARDRWDAVLCDHSMPSFGSSEALSIAQAADPDLPVVIISGTIGEEATVAALRSGARDVVLKSNLARLGAVLAREVREAEGRRRRRQADEEVVRLAAIAESSSDAIVGMALDGTVTSWNAAAERIFGRRAAEALGRPVAQVLPDAVRSELERFEVASVELELDRIDVELTISPVYDPAGGIIGASAFTRDVSERRRAERERKSLQDQLHQAQKMEAVAALAGGIAHDFNNLLTVVIGYTDHLLGRSTVRDEVRDGLEQIRLAADRGSALTRQMLAFSRRQTLHQRVIDLNVIIEGVEPMLRRVLREDLRLVVDPDREIGFVRADPGQLEQVILNLVVNARDAMPDGGVLTIQTREAELDGAFLGSASLQAGRYVALSVEDTGVGMDAETRARVFEPFFTTKEVGKGTGLGLASVYGIVNQSGGLMRVHSAPGAGSTFTVYLPVVDAPVEPVRAPRHDHDPPARTETVMVVEDDGGIRHLLSYVLSGSGHTVLAAADGQEALELSERHAGPIHLVITDIVMPGLSGPELARRLHARAPATKLLFMSGYNELDVLPETGGEFIQKPFSTAALLDKVAELLD